MDGFSGCGFYVLELIFKVGGLVGWHPSSGFASKESTVRSNLSMHRPQQAIHENITIKEIM